MSDCKSLEPGEEIARLRDERDALLEEVRTRADESHRIVALEKERDALKANLDDLTEEHRRDLDKLSEVRIERNKAREDAESLAKAIEDWANLRSGSKEVESALAAYRASTQSHDQPTQTKAQRE